MATVESSAEAVLRVRDILPGLQAEGAHRAVHEVRFAELGLTAAQRPYRVDPLADRLAGAEGFAGSVVNDVEEPDGRPYDIDYGQQHDEEAMLSYAVGCRACPQGSGGGRVEPYLVTFDPDGAGYLGSACEPAMYHVIADKRDLPRALAEICVSIRGRR
ncbi:hypothetical protein [Sinomonas soli]